MLVYQIVHAEGGDVPHPNGKCHHWEYLKALGFPVTDVAQRFDDLESAIAYTETFQTRRDELTYETDGMVIKIDDLDWPLTWASWAKTRAARSPTSSRRGK